MDLGLAGKVALVAGGSSGIGLATAKELAKEGAHVAIGARDPRRLEAAAREVKEVAAGRVMATSVDITDTEAAQRWVEEVAAEQGTVHIVFVCGGSPPRGPASQFDIGQYRAAVDQILIPAVGLALAALPHLRANGWGRLLFVASETASMSMPLLTLSGVTRTALVRFAQGLAAETGPDGITVNVLAPGHTRTPAMERLAASLGGDSEEHLRAMGHHSAIGRLGRPEEIAAMAAFLAGERASFITGGVHLVDGGTSAMGPELPHLGALRKDT